MKFAFIAEKAGEFGVVALCSALGVSTSGYYAWKSRFASAHEVEDRKLRVEIREVHERGRSVYGSPRVHRGLRKKGIRISRKRVCRLMQQEGLVGRPRRRFKNTTDSSHSMPVAENLLARGPRFFRQSSASTTNSCAATMAHWFTTPPMRALRFSSATCFFPLASFCSHWRAQAYQWRTPRAMVLSLAAKFLALALGSAVVGEARPSIYICSDFSYGEEGGESSSARMPFTMATSRAGSTTTLVRWTSNQRQPRFV